MNNQSMIDFDYLRLFINRHRIRLNLAAAEQEFHSDLNTICFIENILFWDMLLSGSCAEFYIDPPFPCIGDFDLMRQLISRVTFFEDRPIDVDMLRRNEHHFYPETRIFRVRPVPRHPAYVTVEYVGDLKISRNDIRRYQFCFNQENITSRASIQNYSKYWRIMAIRVLFTKALLRQSRKHFS